MPPCAQDIIIDRIKKGISNSNNQAQIAGTSNHSTNHKQQRQKKPDLGVDITFGASADHNRRKSETNKPRRRRSTGFGGRRGRSDVQAPQYHHRIRGRRRKKPAARSPSGGSGALQHARGRSASPERRGRPSPHTTAAPRWSLQRVLGFRVSNGGEGGEGWKKGARISDGGSAHGSFTAPARDRQSHLPPPNRPQERRAQPRPDGTRESGVRVEPGGGSGFGPGRTGGERGRK